MENTEIIKKNIQFHNLLRIPIKVNYINDEIINSSSSKNIDVFFKKLYLPPLFKVFILLNNEWIFYGKYIIQYPIENVYINNQTSRFIGADWDNQLITSSNAVGGRPWITIHNLTKIPLYFNNGEIYISPLSSIKYKGREHFGVSLGFTLKNLQGIFSDMIMIYPITDVYYGIVSQTSEKIQPFSTDVRRDGGQLENIPSFAGWNWSFKPNTIPEPNQLFSEGFY